jgi:hypothetical protein
MGTNRHLSKGRTSEAGEDGAAVGASRGASARAGCHITVVVVSLQLVFLPLNDISYIVFLPFPPFIFVFQFLWPFPSLFLFGFLLPFTCFPFLSSFICFCLCFFNSCGFHL